MRVTNLAAGFAALILLSLSSLASAQGGPTLPPPQIHVPNRPGKPLFAGEQGGQRTEINYDRKTQIVTLRLVVQDSNGYFIPDIHRENFAVYENGIRQQNATVEIEHAAVSAGVLVEYGGHYHALNEALAATVSLAVGQFADEIGSEDNIAVWKYGDHVEEISGFAQGNDPLHQAAASLRSAPPFSELNFYDAVIATLPRLHEQSGRRALLLFSSGIDTFSKASYADTLRAAGRSDVPIYALNIGPAVRNDASLYGLNGPYMRLDWKGAEKKLSRIAQASGGRMYSPNSSLDLAAIYDDLMENLRVRYVIIYKSTASPEERGARTVRVELVDSGSDGPVRIVDADGKPVQPKVFVKGRYDPAAADTRRVSPINQGRLVASSVCH
jgi:VWFA-related protein